MAHSGCRGTIQVRMEGHRGLELRPNNQSIQACKSGDGNGRQGAAPVDYLQLVVI